MYGLTAKPCKLSALYLSNIVSRSFRAMLSEAQLTSYLSDNTAGRRARAATTFEVGRDLRLLGNRDGLDVVESVHCKVDRWVGSGGRKAEDVGCSEDCADCSEEIIAESVDLLYARDRTMTRRCIVFCDAHTEPRWGKVSGPYCCEGE